MKYCKLDIFGLTSPFFKLVPCPLFVFFYLSFLRTTLELVRTLLSCSEAAPKQ